MARTVRALFDGEVLRPETPIDLEPNTTYVLTVEGEGSVEDGTPSDGAYPLTEIGRLATDMGVADLSPRHDWYAHGRVPRCPPTGHRVAAADRAANPTPGVVNAASNIG